MSFKVVEPILVNHKSNKRFVCIVTNQLKHMVIYYYFGILKNARDYMKHLCLENMNNKYINVTLYDNKEQKYLHNELWGY